MNSTQKKPICYLCLHQGILMWTSVQGKRRKQVEANSAFLANLQRFSTLISKKTNLLSIKGNEEKEKRSEFRGFVMVIGPSGIQFGLQLYQEFPKLDDTKSSYQLIKTKIPFEKETRHRLYFFHKKRQKTTTTTVNSAKCETAARLWRVLSTYTGIASNNFVIVMIRSVIFWCYPFFIKWSVIGFACIVKIAEDIIVLSTCIPEWQPLKLLRHRITYT